MVSIQDRAKKRAFAVNDRGLRIGQDHPRAVLADDEVNLMLELRAELNPDGTHRFSLSALAAKFDVHKGTVAKICSGDRRGQVPAGFKRARGAGGRG